MCPVFGVHYKESFTGYFVEGSKPIFVPRQVVEPLKGAEKAVGG